MKSAVIMAGACIGILGDGQIGRMEILQGAPLGYTFFVLGPGGKNSPAGQIATWAEAWGPHGEVSDEVFEAFCARVSRILIEWENVPLPLVKRIEARGIPVCPDSRAIEIAQDRKLEKGLAESLGIPVGEYRLVGCSNVFFVDGTDSLDHDAVMKKRRNGYDGQGQIRIKAGESVKQAWRDLKNAPCILERKIDFACELSVIVVRDGTGEQEMSVYGPFENKHEDGILRTTNYPAQCSSLSRSDLKKAKQAVVTATKTIAESLDLYGILAVEFFVTKTGHILFNEMAPRPHNSGHLTIDCCYTSQFTQYLLAACNLPAGSTYFHSAGTMKNLIGTDYLAESLQLRHLGYSVHDYGKTIAKVGRKMGHAVRRYTSVT